MKSRATGPTFPSIPSLLLALVVLAVLVVLDLLGVLPAAPQAEAQMPRPLETPYNMYQVRQYLMNAHFTTVRTVCPSGCDFATPSAALAYVTTQARSLTRQWTVVVYGGVTSNSLTPNMSYTETSLSVPSFTTLRGYPGSAPSGQSINSTSNPVIELTATSGTQLTLGTASGLSGLTFFTNSTLTGDTVMARTTGSDVNMLENVQLWGNAATGAFAFDILSCESTSVVALNLNTIRGQNGSSSSVRNVVLKSGLGHFQLGRHQPGQGTGQLKTIEVTGGSLRLTWIRIIPGAATDLTVTSGAANVQFSLLASFTGAVTTDTLFSVNGTTTPATCSAGQLFVNTTASAPKICACTSPGVWKCSPLV
jgi:hypothetical protein